MNPEFFDNLVYDARLGSCPLCKSKSIKPLYTIERYRPSFKTDRCADCGFIFMNPRFKKNIIDNFYSENYFRGNAEYSYYDERDARKYARYVWEKRIKAIRRFIPDGPFLDIGAAFGGFLGCASEYFSPYGIEPSVYAGEHAKKIFGDNIHIGTLDDHPFKNNFFSVITMIEVLEHLADPVKAIQECSRLLKSGGLLLIQTANMDGMQAKYFKDRYAYFMPGHLSYFTKKNLSGLLLRSNFTKVLPFHPVEFGLLPKLLKSRYTFHSIRDYRRWLRIAGYHCLSKLRFGNFAATSSLVLYAFKQEIR